MILTEFTQLARLKTYSLWAEQPNTWAEQVRRLSKLWSRFDNVWFLDFAVQIQMYRRQL